MGVSEKRQNFHFGVEYPFKCLPFLIYKVVSSGSHNRCVNHEVNNLFHEVFK